VTGRFNFLLSDGETIAATTAGHTLYYRQSPDGPSVTVASEPGDDQPGWIEIPRDGSLISATPEQVSVARLPALNSIIAGTATAHETPEVPDTPDGRIAIP
jgi:hypothetical protein